MVENKVHYQKIIKVVGNRVCVFKQSAEYVGRRSDNGDNLKTDRSKAYKGNLSQLSVKKTRERIYSWCKILQTGNNYFAGRDVELVLITLTLSSPQQFHNKHDDKYIKANMLELFMKWLGYNFDIRCYYWRAESQENGNIHFHILVDNYVPKERIQAKWNSIQKKEGYLISFYDKFKHENAPSTHVRKFDQSEKSIEYLVKYVTKETGTRLIEGLQHRFSNNLTKLIIPVCPLEAQEQNRVFNCLEKDCMFKFNHEFFMFFIMPSYELEKLLELDNAHVLETYYLAAFEFLYKKSFGPTELLLLNLYMFDKHGFKRYCYILDANGYDYSSCLALLVNKYS
jgi:hypothetical protein